MRSKEAGILLNPRTLCIASDVRRASYATAVGGKSRVRVSGVPAVDVPKLSNFYIVPDNNSQNENIPSSSQATKEMLCRIFKPSDCGLKINRITFARDNSVRVEAQSPDINKIKKHPALLNAGLKVVEQIKINPRLIVYGIPADMSPEEIQKELVAQNLGNEGNANLKVVYSYPVKPNSNTTSCVLEISPQIRNTLLSCGRICSVCTG